MVAEVTTAYGHVRSGASATPDKAALIIDGEVLGYRALYDSVERIRAGLVGHGVAAGDRVLLDRLGDRQHLTVLLAAIGLGAVPVCAPGGARQVHAHCEPALTVTANDAASADIKCPHVIAAELENSDAAAVSDGHAELPADRVGMLLYTSGTTGRPLGVLLEHGALACTTRYITQTMRLDCSAVEYVASPLDHAFGLGRVRSLLACGATLVRDSGPLNAARILRAVDAHACNSIAATSSGFALLLEHFRDEFESRGPLLHWMEIGSLPLTLQHKERLLQLAPNARIFMNYGLTEGNRSTFLDLRATPAEHRGSVGRAAPSVDVAVSALDEILIRGPHLASGYWRDDAAWNERYRDGWFHTGDTGRLDEHGYLYFHSRRDDLINVGGEKHAPTAVEDQLSELLAGVGYCVVGIPDPRGILGEIPVLCIEGDHPVTLREVRQAARERLPEGAVPRQIVHLATLPRTHNGKIQRRNVKAMLAERADP